MPLSDRDQRILDQLEASLRAEHARSGRTWAAWAAVGVGLVGFLTGLFTATVPVAVSGWCVLLVGTHRLLRARIPGRQ